MSQAKTRPNVLLVVVHDLGTSLGCYGNPDISSPRFDRFADDGVRFDANFCTAPYCSPSRGSIITGKYPHVNGLMGLVNIGWNLPVSNTTDAMLFGGTGYETALFGYQHEVKDPTSLGFETVNMKNGSSADRVSPNVVEYLDTRGQSDRPFYLRVGFFDTHRINAKNERTGEIIGNDWRIYRDRAADPNELTLLPFMEESEGIRRDLADFYGAVNFVDENFGYILDALDRNGLADNTIVVFTTDHGVDFPLAKTTLYDPGINTSLLMRWPGGFAGGQTVGEMISGIDLLPTLLECCSIAAPKDVEGRSFLPFLRGKEYRSNERIFAEKNNDPFDIKRCIRTNRWKLIHNFSRDLFDVTPLRHYGPEPEGDPADGSFDRIEWELYDLENDPAEKRNYSGNPDVAAVEQDLRNQLAVWQVETDDPVLSGMMCRPLDEPANWVRAMRGRPWRPTLE